MAVPGARRSGVREENVEEGQKAKQGFVEVGRGDVGVSFLLGVGGERMVADGD